MKQLKHWLLAILIIPALAIGFTACGGDDDDDEPGSSDLVGTWYGKMQYSLHGATKTHTLTVTFQSNGSGSLSYDAPSRYVAGEFTYKVSGKTITCKGVTASTDGSIDEDFEMKMTRNGDRITTQSTWPGYVLTRDGSVTIDSSGNEI
ncbi:MAG: hypothetical protein LIP02_01720 [Bacteroidales bacterium]|nr:hypothetical protein [Bacteroidales bacterium]